jgi:hypothetical protein
MRFFGSKYVSVLFGSAKKCFPKQSFDTGFAVSNLWMARASGNVGS